MTAATDSAAGSAELAVIVATARSVPAEPALR